MNTSVGLLKAVLDGLPRQSIIKLSIDGKLYDMEVAGITRMNGLPDPRDPSANRKFQQLKEYVILADNGNFQFVKEVIDVKQVYKAIKGKEGVSE